MIQEVGETSMPLAPGAVNGQNKTRIRGPGFGVAQAQAAYGYYSPQPACSSISSRDLTGLVNSCSAIMASSKQIRKTWHEQNTKRLRIRPSFYSPPDSNSLLPRFTVEQCQSPGCTAAQAK